MTVSQIAGVEAGLVRAALADDLTIDIITTGARTGVARTTEIWFVRVDGEIYICGTGAPDAYGAPARPRDWLANLKANPDFTFVLKESIQVALSARAEVIVDSAVRTRVFSAPETVWYREHGSSLEALVRSGPMVQVLFTGDAAVLND